MINFFFNNTATTEIYILSLHDALPIYGFELERAGQYDQAAAIYLATLRAEPTNLSALLGLERERLVGSARDRKSTRLNSSHTVISYAVFCLKKKNISPS